MEKPKKQLTDKQTAFLEHLLGDARGNVRLAMDMAGYAKTTAVQEVVGNLRGHCQIKPPLSGRGPRSRLSSMIERSPFRYFKTSPEIIRLAVMMYIRFPLSLRNVEDLLHERGIDISHETVRFWWNRFGPLMAAEIKQKRIQQLRAYSKWKWHVDEVFVKINGERHYLWRAVDAEGEVLESVVTKRRNKDASLKMLKTLMKRYGRAERIVTDRLRSYGAALRELGCPAKQETGRWLNNRAENSHQPFDERSGRCSGSGKCEVCRNLPPFTLPSLTTSIRIVATYTALILSKAAPLL